MGTRFPALMTNRREWITDREANRGFLVDTCFYIKNGMQAFMFVKMGTRIPALMANGREWITEHEISSDILLDKCFHPQYWKAR